MPSLTTILLTWGILAPLAMYGWLTVAVADAERDGVRNVAAAVTRTTTEQVNVCNGRVAQIESTLKSEALETARAAREADERAADLRRQLDVANGTAADVTRVKAVIEDLCRTRASCRDRHKLSAAPP